MSIAYLKFQIFKASSLVSFPRKIIFLRSSTVLSQSRCALRLRYVELVVSIEVAVEVCCCFTVFSC
jgi:hypothetical protein